jgi:uncharacterized membrane protein YdbT with pleckstrin-like domain
LWNGAVQYWLRKDSTVPDLTIQPTAKFLKAGTILAAIVVLGLEIAYYSLWSEIEGLHWVPLAAPVIFVWPALRWLRRSFTRTTIGADRLRYETGALSKSTRTIQLSKLQDVRVDQRFAQRVVGTGDLSIETAGETSRLTLHNVDSPQALADEIMNRAQKGPAPL